MVQLFDKQSGAAIGSITEAQLKFLIDQLEEESSEDKDYYLNQANLDYLREQKADPALLEVLKNALGNANEMEISWKR